MAAEDRIEQLETAIFTCPVLAPIIERWATIDLPDGWLSGSVIAQTVWNRTFGLPPDHGLADVDLVYFDALDLSAAGEARQAERIRGCFPDIPLRIDTKNQARVHLWYEGRFGYSIAPYRSATQAIATFPTTASAIGIQPGPSGLHIHAPFGLSDLLNGVVRPNKAQITRTIYENKIARWRQCWPGLTITDWTDAPQS